MNELNDLQQTLLTIYEQNKQFLQQYNIALYNKIIQQEQVTNTEYNLSFENNKFDIVDSKNNKRYNCDPFYDAQVRSKNIHSSQAIFSLVTNKIKFHRTAIKGELSAHQYVQQFLDLPNQTLSSKKFIFIGTLLGVHLNDIHRAIRQESYLILEPHIEIFRLSMFLTDYTELAKESKLFFAINQTKEEENSTLHSFLEYKYEYNHYIKFELASEVEYPYVDSLTHFFTLQSPLIYPFSEKLLNLQRGLSLLKSSPNGILSCNEDILPDLPVLFLAAGPSLEANINLIKKVQDKFIIVCVGAALKRLSKEDICPNIIISIDKAKEDILSQFNVPKKYYTNSMIVLSTKTDQEVFEKLNSNQTFLLQIGIPILKEATLIQGRSVGDIGYQLLLQLGAKEIYLLGIDAALNPTTLQTHDSLHENNQTLNIQSDDFSYDTDIVMVQGNQLEQVPTTLTYLQIIDSFNEIDTNQVKSFNLSTLGAKLKGCTSFDIQKTLHFESIENKDTFLKKVLETLQSNCLSQLAPQDIQKYIKEEEQLSYIKPFSKQFKQQLSQQLEKFPQSLYLKILNEYLYLIAPYENLYEKRVSEKVYTAQLKELFFKLNTLFRTYN